MNDDDPDESRGPREIHRIADRATGLDAVIVLDDMTLGPALGGVRFAAAAEAAAAEAEARGLARAMTSKCALAGLPAGGGKAFVRTGALTNRAAACRLFGEVVESLGGAFRTAGDLGATAADLDAIGERTRHVARAAECGDLGDATAIGLLAAADAVAARLGTPLEAMRVTVQGLGTIGGALVRRLAARGIVPRVADFDAGRIESIRGAAGIAVVAPQHLVREPCDMLFPCARGGLVDDAFARAIKARAIVSGANRLLATRSAGAILWRRGILCPPDFVVNAGAVIRGGWFALRGISGTDDEILAIGTRVATLLDEARDLDVPPEVAAERRAGGLIAAARA